MAREATPERFLDCAIFPHLLETPSLRAEGFTNVLSLKLRLRGLVVFVSDHRKDGGN